MAAGERPWGVMLDSPSSCGSNADLLSSTTTFHEAAVFCGIWVLVLLVGVHTLTYLGSILEPFMWAFFLMMGLLPLTDWIEKKLHLLLNLPRKCRVAVNKAVNREEDSELERLEQLPDASRADVAPDDAHDAGSCTCNCGAVRMVAVLLVIVLFVGLIGFIVVLIYQSTVHMQKSWHIYQEGGRRIGERIDKMRDLIPDEILERLTKQSLTFMEDAVSWIIGLLAQHVQNILVEVLTMLLYMMFWLCEPIPISKKISKIMKNYFLLKGFASLGYALSVWCVLHFLKIDLAIVFGVLTFFFNWIPEVGPLFAMLLPLPVVLFDSRLAHPFVIFGLAFGLQLALKFLFGNIVEVKLVERQEDMRMHPVVILFFVAFFGFIWGPTGMLLSVPIVAVAKAAVSLFPDVYRDPILIMIEGDKNAPARFRRPVSP